MKDSLLGFTISVRASGGTYVARPLDLNRDRLTASCTMGAEQAALAFLRKVDPSGQHQYAVRQDTDRATVYGQSFWTIVPRETQHGSAS